MKDGWRGAISLFLQKATWTANPKHRKVIKLVYKWIIPLSQRGDHGHFCICDYEVIGILQQH